MFTILAVKCFNSILQAFLHCNWYVIMHKDFICTVAYFLFKELFFVFCLGDIIHFSCIFTWPLKCKEQFLTKSSLLCENTDKFFSSNNEALLTYWPLQKNFFTLFYRYFVKILFYRFYTPSVMNTMYICI